jgi:hypothetical protein
MLALVIEPEVLRPIIYYSSYGHDPANISRISLFGLPREFPARIL